MMPLSAWAVLAAVIVPTSADRAAEIEQVAVEATAPHWRPVDAGTGAIRDLEGLAALARDFPDSGSVRLRLLNAQLQASEWAALLETLCWLRERGYVFSEVAQSQIPKLVDEEFADEAKRLLLPPAESIEKSEVVWTLPAEAGLVESLLVDVEEDRMVATSVSSRSLWGASAGGGWREVQIEGADNLSGIVYDNRIGEIWVASGNIDQSADEEQAFAGFIGALNGSGRIAAPDGVILSDVHRAPDGTIYASDPIGGGIYAFDKDRKRIEELIAPGTFRSPQGLATSADGHLLYVSDYRYGIAIIDLGTGTVFRLSCVVPSILDGTDALFRRGNSLFAIQNGTSPMRIAQFDLSPDGMVVVGHHVLEQAHAGWTEPLGGYLAPDALYYVANGQWDKFVAGELGEGKAADPVEIRRLPLEE